MTELIETVESEESEASVIDLDEDAAPPDNQPDDANAQTDEHPAGGRWAVTLHMRFEQGDAADPVAAVDAFMQSTLTWGMRGLVYMVRDRYSDEGDTVFVENGVSYTEEEYDAKIAAEEDELVTVAAMRAKSNGGAD